jgi:hypothetical protein
MPGKSAYVESRFSAAHGSLDRLSVFAGTGPRPLPNRPVGKEVNEVEVVDLLVGHASRS